MDDSTCSVRTTDTELGSSQGNLEKTCLSCEPLQVWEPGLMKCGRILHGRAAGMSPNMKPFIIYQPKPRFPHLSNKGSNTFVCVCCER